MRWLCWLIDKITFRRSCAGSGATCRSSWPAFLAELKGEAELTPEQMEEIQQMFRDAELRAVEHPVPVGRTCEAHDDFEQPPCREPVARFQRFCPKHLRKLEPVYPMAAVKAEHRGRRRTSRRAG